MQAAIEETHPDASGARHLEGSSRTVSLTSGLRRVGALESAEGPFGSPAGAAPAVQWVSPTDLFVDETYQRNLSKRSILLIKRIVGAWDWRRFKPPIVAKTDVGFEVIDGQHTAIAAATHPDIALIPVMVVSADERATRAGAFIGHNRDRIAITSTQMYFAALTAGDEDARTIEQVCHRAGVTILKYPPPNGYFEPGQTVAVTAIARLVERRGAMKARQVLEVLRLAEMAPVSAAAIRASELLLFDPEFAGEIEPGEITMTLMALAESADHEAKLFAATHKIPYWRALASVIFRRRRRSPAQRARGD